MKRIAFFTLVLVITCFLSQPAQAAPTPAGTLIENNAQVDYTIGVTNFTAYTGTVSVLVDEIVDVTVAPSVATTVLVNSLPAAEVYLRFSVSNNGNGSEDFTLTADSLAGPGFTPDQPPRIFEDAGTIGTYDGPGVEQPYGGSISIPMDTTIFVWVVHDIADTTLNDGDTAQVTLTATHMNAPISTAPGYVYDNGGLPGPGDGGGDLVLGIGGGTGSGTAFLEIQQTTISITKGYAVANSLTGGTEPTPGAVILYTIDVSVTGAGTATGVTVRDFIPVDTQYVPGSLALDSGSGPAPAGTVTGVPPEVIVNIGNLDAAAGTQTVTFEVTID